jgi:hypothetical protein
MKKLILRVLILISIIQTTRASVPEITQSGTAPEQNNRLPASMIDKRLLVLPGDSAIFPVNEQDYYLQKSKNQKTAAWILLSGGIVCAGIGVAIGVSQIDNMLISAFEGNNTNRGTGATILFYAGSAMALGSIPLFIAAGKNKRKAFLMPASQKTSFALPPDVPKYVNGITLIIPLGK